MKLKKIEDVKLFLDTVNKCEGNVWLKSIYGDNFNMKSALSQYVAIAKILGEYGDEMELFTDDKRDEALFIKLFSEHPEFISNRL